jgi:hypothetical protein
MGEPQSQSVRCEDEKNILLLPGIEPRILGRPECRYRSRGDDNIKIGLRKIKYGGVDCVQLVKRRVEREAFMHTVMNFLRSNNRIRFLDQVNIISS